MADYGLTQQGINIKRLDTILEEMHTELSEKWNINTQQNQNSLLNVLLTNIADMIAELWELGQDVYYSQYPTSAEGMFLDNVGQFIGISRETDVPSYYRILCVGTEGTVIPTSTMIASTTNPAVYLYPVSEKRISKSSFNKVWIKIASIDGNPVSVELNGNHYSVTPESGASATTILNQLAGEISDEDFSVSVNENDNLLYIEAVQDISNNTLVISENLTTENIGCVFTFRTKEVGDIPLPAGCITEIAKAVTGLKAVTNVGTYIAGRLAETDAEFRKSYMEKIFSHSGRMVESIKSTILDNCQGVTAIAVYENNSNSVDSEGRPPHSIEVVIDGGEETEIAQWILNTKAGGIYTFGDQEITLVGENGEEIVVRFNRPEFVRVWFRVEISKPNGVTLPENYAEIIRNIIITKINTLGCGDDIIPQNLFLKEIYEKIYGIDFVSITMAITDSEESDDQDSEETESDSEQESEEEGGDGNESEDDAPDSYTLRNVYVDSRQRCITSEQNIEVVVSV